MINSLGDIHQWTLGDPEGLNYDEIVEQIQSRFESYNEYHPTIGPFQNFEGRLLKWLNSSPVDEDQRIMLRMVPEILFISSQEVVSLHRTAFNEIFLPWLVKQEGLSIISPSFQEQLRDGITKTWFCPITDSMHISDFYHVNNLRGADLRPDWRSLQQFADVGHIEEYMRFHNFKYLVLLEDFIGSGNQIEDSLNFAARMPGNYPTLVIPFVTCPRGLILGKNLQRIYGTFTFEPVLSLAKPDLVGDHHEPNEPELFELIRGLCNKLSHLFPWQYGAFGYRNTGALYVAYTNCPDNTLSMIHDDADGRWEPLFPRSPRI